MSEIEAMKAIDESMEDLEPEVAKRVLRWAVDKFGQGEVQVEQQRQSNLRGAGGGGGVAGEYERISDLMDAASPSTIVDHVLVASYWFQVINGQENFTSMDVNSELKDLGHPASNITDSYNSLKSRRPPAVRQVEKSGKTRQARKRYRLTTEGIRSVERMLRGESEE